MKEKNFLLHLQWLYSICFFVHNNHKYVQHGTTRERQNQTLDASDEKCVLFLILLLFTMVIVVVFMTTRFSNCWLPLLFFSFHSLGFLFYHHKEAKENDKKKYRRRRRRKEKSVVVKRLKMPRSAHFLFVQ